MTHDTPTDPTDQSGSDRGPDVADEETKLVVEFTVRAEDFVLAETIERVPEKVLEFERLVPTSEDLLPYLWATEGEIAAFEEAAVADSSVETLCRVATFDDGALYRVTWTDCADRLLAWLRERDAVVLQAETKRERWLVKLRVDSPDALGSLQTYCREQDISFEIVRLYEMTEPKMGQYNVSEKQRELLVLALEMGYFEVPRKTKLEDVAERIGISSKAASERLRRGQTNLLSNTLTVGEPTGIGVDGDR